MFTTTVRRRAAATSAALLAAAAVGLTLTDVAAAAAVAAVAGVATCTSPAVQTFTPPAGTDNPFGISAGPDGTTWFAHGSSIDKIDDGVLTEYPVPDPSAADLGWVAWNGGPVVWFADRGTGRLGVVNETGSMHEYPIPDGVNGAAVPQSLVFGPGKTVWFTDQANDRIGHLDVDASTFAFYAVPTKDSTTLGMVRGLDGDLYFTERSADKLGRLDPDTGLFTEWSLPTNSFPNRLAVDPSGNIWFTELHRNKLAHLDVSGHLHERNLPGGAVGLIYHHNYLYAALSASGQLARITLGGAVQHLWTLPGAGLVLQLAASNGFVWLGDTGNNHVYRVNTLCS
jgi:virginiamycin B lyase